MNWILICLLLIWIVTQCCLSARLPGGTIVAQPDTTDEEFCGLMPNVPPEVALKVRQILVDATGWDQEEIHPDTRLIEFEL